MRFTGGKENGKPVYWLELADLEEAERAKAVLLEGAQNARYCEAAREYFFYLYDAINDYFKGRQS